MRSVILILFVRTTIESYSFLCHATVKQQTVLLFRRPPPSSTECRTGLRILGKLVAGIDAPQFGTLCVTISCMSDI